MNRSYIFQTGNINRLDEIVLKQTFDINQVYVDSGYDAYKFIEPLT